MGYFPFYIDIKNKPCLVVGGGIVALRKIEKLLSFEPKISVVSPVICNEIDKITGLNIINRKFCDDDIEGKTFVISATDDNEVNRHIFKLCQEKNILVNTVDDKEKCGFIFPALVMKNDITVGITTSGKSPLYAQFLRREIEEVIDDKSSDIVKSLGDFRGLVKQKIDAEDVRKIAFEQMLSWCIKNHEAIDEKVAHSIIEGLKKHNED